MSERTDDKHDEGRLDHAVSSLPPISGAHLKDWLAHNVKARFQTKGALTPQDMRLMDTQISICTELLARRDEDAAWAQRPSLAATGPNCDLCGHPMSEAGEFCRASDCGMPCRHIKRFTNAMPVPETIVAGPLTTLMVFDDDCYINGQFAAKGMYYEMSPDGKLSRADRFFPVVNVESSDKYARQLLRACKELLEYQIKGGPVNNTELQVRTVKRIADYIGDFDK